MTKEELIGFLKDNLHIEVNRTWNTFNPNEWVDIKLLLCEEEISSDGFELKDPENWTFFKITVY